MSRLTARNTALCVVDMQGCEQESIQEPQWVPLVFNIRNIIDEARSHAIPIIHIFLYKKLIRHHGPYQHQKGISPFTIPASNVLRSETEEAHTLDQRRHIIEPCYPNEGEFVLGKNRSDAFREGNFLTGKESFRKTENIIVTGVLLDDCVLETAIGAWRNNYHVIVPPETTESPNHACQNKKKFLDENLKYGMEAPSLSSVIDRMHSARQRMTSLFGRLIPKL